MDPRVNNMACKLILASKSPRRRAFFDMLGLEYEAISPDVDESVDKTLTPSDTVKAIAAKKALACAGDGLFVIAADTVVVLDGKILGKPKDREDARKMISSYSGRSHEVITGFAIVCDGKIFSASTSTKVFFKKLSGAQIKYYLDTDEPYDKAGAYGIQGIAGLFVNRIEGDYNNVVGLPLCDLDSLMIEKFGFGLNKFKKS